jgi:hypothetical protein
MVADRSATKREKTDHINDSTSAMHLRSVLMSHEMLKSKYYVNAGTDTLLASAINPLTMMKRKK